MSKYIKPTPEQITKWVIKNFPDYKTKKGGVELRINNPLSIDDGYHLWINTSKAAVNDFRPDYHDVVSGSFLRFVKKYLKCSFFEAVREVCGDNVAYAHAKNLPFSKREITKQTLPVGFKLFTESVDIYSEPTLNYLRSRCVDDDQIMENKIGFKEFSVVFPYYEHGESVYWQSRSILNKDFDFPPDSNKSDFIYGFDNIDPDERVIITESIFNALMFDNAVAVGGSEISDNQKLKLRKLGVKDIIVAFDNDGAGRHGISKCYNMKNYFNVRYSLTDGEDDWNKISQDLGILRAQQMLFRNVKDLTLRESIRLKK